MRRRVSIDTVADYRAKFAADDDAAQRRMDWLDRMADAETMLNRRGEREAGKLLAIIDNLAEPSGERRSA